MSRKMLIKPFRSIESAATATHNWRRRQILCAGASTLVLGLVAPRLARASSVLGVRVWPARDYTRVTIESDQPLQNSQQLLQGPDRLVVDLTGLDLDKALRDAVSKIAPNDPQIQSVRVGQYQPHVVRMVFDLKGSVKPQVFTLPPVGTYKYRLVFDLYPAVAPDPLSDLIAQTERKEQALNDTARAQQMQPPTTLAGRVPPPPAAGDNSDAFFQRFAQNTPATPHTPPATPSTPAKPAVKPPPVIARRDDSDDDGDTTSSPHRNPARGSTVRLLTVAIDPGHGGEDPGAIGGGGTYEAHRARHREAAREDRRRAEHARDDDARRRLLRAAERARAESAPRGRRPVRVDPRRCIHDAVRARGSSVFALSDHGATSAARALDGEQGELVRPDRRHQHQDGGRGREPRAVRHVDDGADPRFAALRQLRAEGSGRHQQAAQGNRSRQAGFAVLKAPDIPSILVETAFISNPEEESRLNDDGYRDQMADAIFRGIKRYFAANPPLAKSRMA